MLISLTEDPPHRQAPNQHPECFPRRRHRDVESTYRGTLNFARQRAMQQTENTFRWRNSMIMTSIFVAVSTTVPAQRT
jgi:hypothetical protein